MKRLLVFIVALLCATAFTQPIQACVCREYGTPICARYWRSDAVFVGQVVDIKAKNTPDGTWNYFMVTFTVEESFRGVSGPRIVVGTLRGTSCDIVFKKGKRYLVYATRENISGRIVTNQVLGLPGLKIEVTGNDKTFQTLTTKYGDFSVSLPEPGSYKVRVLVPYLTRIMGYTNDISIGGTQTERASAVTSSLTCMTAIRARRRRLPVVCWMQLDKALIKEALI